MQLSTLFVLPRLALSATTKALRLLADAGETLASTLAPSPSQTHDERATPTASAPATSPAAPPPAEPAAARVPTAAEITAGTVTLPDVPTIAAWPAPQVVAAAAQLSTVQLSELHEYESRHRRRRTVLDAIEAAVLPPPAAADPADLELLDEVRVPDELVYTTQTPRRRR